MFGKGNKIYSIMSGNCPKCHEDYMYMNKNPYIISETMKMHDYCRSCGFKYKVEPNFFFGAMYVSYGLAVLTGIISFLISNYLFEATLTGSFLAILVCLILLMPIITRLSRNIYINIFVNFSPDAARKNMQM
ncbi:MAG TPA: DUF983 domain-containing protein [Flavobacterium sp.]